MPETHQERLDEVVVTKPFDLEEAISSLRFYWNLAKHKGQPIVMELWGAPDLKGATHESTVLRRREV